MIQINTLDELEAVIVGGVNFVLNEFEKQRIVCHPIAPITFLPSSLDFIPDDVRKGIAAGFMLLYSIDSKEWSHNYKAVKSEAMNTDGHFYITDWKFNIVMEVEYYMIEELDELLKLKIEELTLIEKFKWKESELGEIATFTFSEYFRP